MQVPELPLMPEQASTVAGHVDAVYLYFWAVTLILTGLVTIIVTVFVVKYRRRSPNEIPRQIHGSITLETASSVFLGILFLTYFVLGADLYFRLYRVPAEAESMTFHVVGKQWMWKFQHPTGEREINELHVPLGTKVKFMITTEDVIHSLYFPEFRVKSDAVPGRYTTAWFEATKEGTFKILCTEYCGTDHSGMGGRVIVMKPTDYQEWLAGNRNQASPIEAGRELYTSLGCASCHGENSEGGRCPPLIQLYGKQVNLEDGTTVVADENYVRESILNPAAKLVAGYPNIMPTYQGQLSEEQLLQLVTYIKSLAPAQQDGIETTQPARDNNPRTGPATLEAQGTSDPGSLRSNPISTTPPSNSGLGGSSSGAGQQRPRPENQVIPR